MPMKSLDELSTAITKAACIQVVHEQGPLNVPVSAAVDHDMLNQIYLLPI